MPTMTVREAARRLGVKPSKVQLLIGQRKLSARSAPPEPGQRGANHIVLDADEVEMLARVRAHKHRAKASTPATAEAPPTAEPEREERSEALSGDVESASVIDETGRRMVALVQSMLAPLVAELHDARETIRRQAEELGALRATVSELERRTTIVPAPPILPPDRTEPSGAASPDRTAAEAPASAPARVAPVPGMPTAPAAQAVVTIGRVPLWRRALTHALR